MAVKRGDTFVEGIDVIIRRDLEKHKSLLEQNNAEILALTHARSNEIAKKRFYGEQKGQRRYRDEAMDEAIAQMNTNIKGYSLKLALLEEDKALNTRIVDKLTEDLDNYDKQLIEVLKFERDHLKNANSP